MALSKEKALTVALDWEFPEEARAVAVDRLADLGDAEMVVPLGVLLSQTTEGRLRSALKTTLQALSARDQMIASLERPDPNTRELALEILGALGDPKVVPVLIGALQDAHPRIREAAAGCLVEFRTAQALPALAKCVLEDPDPDVRMAAAQALGELDDPEALQALERARQIELDAFTMILIEESIARLSEETHR